MKIITFFKENFGVRSYTAELEGEIIFVKESVNEEGQAMIQREYTNQSFLWNTSQHTDLGFRFLKPRMHLNTLIYPFIDDSYKWLGNIDGNFFVEPIDEYIDDMITFTQACQQIDIGTLPNAMHIDVQARKQSACDKFTHDAAYLVAQQVITEAQKELLAEKVQIAFETLLFQHHDVVPWHMAKHIQNGEIILIDAGWSGISLYCYDIAYYILQIIAYGNDIDAARIYYKTISCEYTLHRSFEDLLAQALAYRGVRLAAELHTQGKHVQLQQILPIILTGMVKQ